MVCRWSCLVAFAIIVSMVYSTNAIHRLDVVRKYKEQLPADLKRRYESISLERRNIYYQGYLLGFLLSLLVIYTNKNMGRRLGTLSMLCTVVVVSFLTNYFYYILTPKSDWMLNHIQNPDQTKAWLRLYQTMQKYHHGVFALGLVAMVFVALAFRC